MKRFLPGISLLLSLVLITISTFILRHTYSGGNSINRLSRAVDTADGLQIRFFASKDPEEFITLSREEWNTFQEILRNHYLATEMQTMCHDPGQELRFQQGGRTILKGTLCLDCINFEIDSLLFPGTWVTILSKEGDATLKLPLIESFLGALKQQRVGQ